jgi:hypothetical protein
MDSVPPTVPGGPEVAGIASVAARLGKAPAERSGGCMRTA